MTAENLPTGSVVADANTAWIKNHPTHTLQWRATNGSYCTDWRIDEAMAVGAEVLRVGDGT